MCELTFIIFFPQDRLLASGYTTRLQSVATFAPLALSRPCFVGVFIHGDDNGG